jgi:hypothetical protein
MPLPAGRGPSQPSTTPNAAQPVAVPVQGFAGGLPAALARDCPAAPATVTLPRRVSDAMQKAVAGSFPGGRSLEHGGTLVQDGGGNVWVRGVGAGTSGSFTPDRTVAGAGERIIGTFHTHPYDASEGGHAGVSLCGADLGYAVHFKEPVYVDAGTHQFAVMPTQATPVLAPGVLAQDWEQEFSALLGAGKSLQDASSQASNAIARKYGLAYYEGSHGVLLKVGC